MAHRASVTVLVASVLTSATVAQATRVAKESLGQPPSSRHRLAMAYDSARQESVLPGLATTAGLTVQLGH